jgi:hypothetical protein
MNKTFDDFWREWRGPEQAELPLAPESISLTNETNSPPLQDPSTNGQRLRIGQHIVCDQPTGVFRPCPCGSRNFTIHNGVGPHAGQLICNSCGRGGRWLSRMYVELQINDHAE